MHLNTKKNEQKVYTNAFLNFVCNIFVVLYTYIYFRNIDEKSESVDKFITHIMYGRWHREYEKMSQSLCHIEVK